MRDERKQRLEFNLRRNPPSERNSNPGRFSGFQVTGMIEWGAKIKPPPKKIPGPKLNPPKNAMPNFRGIKISRETPRTR